MNRKVKFKTLICTLMMAAAIGSATCIGALANDTKTTEIPSADSAEISPEAIAESAEISAEFPVESTENFEENPENSGAKSFFEQLYLEAESNLDKILSALTLTATMLIGLAYKKGLLPGLDTAVGNIHNAVKSLSDSQKNDAEIYRNGLTSLTKRIESIEKNLSPLTNLLTETCNRLEDANASKSDREKLRCVLLSEVEMLGEIFMSSSLPQYQKDSIGERIFKMKQELKNDESDEK
jgi:hypothetical protein